MDRKVNHEGLLSLEQPLIKVPLEQFRKAFRSSQKYVEKGIVEVSQQVNDIAQKASKGDVDPEEIVKNLDGMVTKLNGLKRKLEDSKSEETLYMQRSKARLDHLTALTQTTTTSDDAYLRWSQIRLDRILVDYMLRQGYTKTAKRLAADSHIEELVDIELFEQTKVVEDSLRLYGCTECLAWCNENKTALRKAKSTLEFNLRLQEFIELVRGRKLTDAITYARKYFTAWSDSFMREIQEAMALLAFDPATNCHKYRHFFDSSRWTHIINQFRRDSYALNSLPSQSLLNMALQAGLSTLKTPMCYLEADKNINCPVCDAATFGNLAERLPCAHHVNSCLVCRISGEIMNEDNYPVIVPSGNVYSIKSLQEMAANNNGNFVDPRSGQSFNISIVRKVHVMT